MPPAKIVVYLDPDLYRSTWLGNKSIYRTRMAIADGGELVIIAPGVEKFGEEIYYISNPGPGLWQTKRGKVNT